MKLERILLLDGSCRSCPRDDALEWRLVLKKIITVFLFFLFVNVALAQHVNFTNQKYHVTYLKNTAILQKKEHLRDQAKLRLAKLQNEQLTQKTEQLLSENTELQNINLGQQQQSEQQQKIIKGLQNNINQLNYVNLSLQEQTKFASPHFVSKQLLMNNPWLNDILQQLDLPLTLTGAVLIIILLLLWLMYKFFIVRYRPNKNLLEHNGAQVTQAEQISQSENDINYKYLAGEDVVTAKLNLAHAYYDMEDYASAKKILIGIVQEGTEQQREEARNLLVKINGT